MMKKTICLSVILSLTHGTALSMMHTRKIVKGTSRLQVQKRMCSENMSAPSSLMNANDKWAIRRAYIDCIYKVAQIEAMCNIAANPNLDHFQKRALRDQVPYVVKE